MSNTPETDECVKENRHLRFLQEDHYVGTTKRTYENPIVFLCQKLERQRDEAVRSCQTWQKGHAELVAERDCLLNQLQVNQPERKHIGRWGHNRQEFTSPYINNSKQ
jgi:hypothetical protein